MRRCRRRSSGAADMPPGHPMRPVSALGVVSEQPAVTGGRGLVARVLGPARLLSVAEWRLLALLGAASFFEGYDFNVITIALRPLRTTFGIDQATAAGWLAVVYLGALPAVVVARRADRHGRRQV